MVKLRNSGLTLLEVMLAVTILSVGLVMVVRSFATSLQTIKTSRNFLVANLLMEEKIWQKREEETGDEGLIPEDVEGKFAEPFDNFSYKISFAEETGLPLLYKSSWEISWLQRKRGQSSSCVTYLRKKQ